MPILNYTTDINANRTLGEIQGIIVKRGARKIMTEYDEQGDPVGLSFVLQVKDNIVHFKMPANYEGVLRSMATTKNIKVKVNKEQAIRVSWRIIKNWIEAQMAMIDAEIALMEQVFLPYAVDRNGVTIFDHFQNNTLLLPPKN